MWAAIGAVVNNFSDSDTNVCHVKFRGSNLLFIIIYILIWSFHFMWFQFIANPATFFLRSVLLVLRINRPESHSMRKLPQVCYLLYKVSTAATNYDWTEHPAIELYVENVSKNGRTCRSIRSRLKYLWNFFNFNFLKPFWNWNLSKFMHCQTSALSIAKAYYLRNVLNLECTFLYNSIFM